MKRFRVTQLTAILAAGILCAFIFFLSLAGCTKATGACDEEQTIKAVSDAALESTKEQLDFVAGFSGGLTKDEWNAIRLGIRVTVDNIRQTAKVGGRYTCSADVVIHQSGGRDSIPVTYVSELKDSGEVKVTVSGM